MILTKALDAYAKHFGLIASVILPAGIIIGLFYCLINFSYDHPVLEYAFSLNIPIYLLSPLWIGALLFAISQLCSEQQSSYQDILIYGLKKWWKLAVVGVIAIGLKALPLFLNSVATEQSFVFHFLFYSIYVLAVFLMVRYILVFPILALENKSIIDSFRRSAELSKGKRISILFEFIGMWALIQIVKFLAAMVVSLMGYFSGGMLFTYLYLILSMGIIEPLVNSLIIVWIYCYYQTMQ